MTAKEKIISTLQSFAYETIDTYISNAKSPLLGLFSSKTKTVADNVISKMGDKLDGVLFYITDKEDNINVADFDDAAIKAALEDMPIMDYNVHGIDCRIGKGCIDILLPSNAFTDMICGDEKILSFTYTDIAKLKELINS